MKNSTPNQNIVKGPGRSFMKNVKTLAICLGMLSTLTLMGCFDCRNDDCPPTARFSFQVENPNGNSLFEPTGFSQTLDSDQIQVVPVDDENEEALRLTQNGVTLHFDVPHRSARLIINYAQFKDDTLDFETEIYQDDCCSNTVVEYQVEINSNGQLVSSSADSTFVFIK